MVKRLLYPDHIWEASMAGVPHSSVRESQGPLPSLALSIRPSTLSSLAGLGRVEEKAAGPQGPLEWFPAAAEGWTSLRPPGSDPAPARPAGPRPALDSPLSTSLPFLAVAAFPTPGRWEKG